MEALYGRGDIAGGRQGQPLAQQRIDIIRLQQERSIEEGESRFKISTGAQAVCQAPVGAGALHPAGDCLLIVSCSHAVVGHFIESIRHSQKRFIAPRIEHQCLLKAPEGIIRPAREELGLSQVLPGRAAVVIKGYCPFKEGQGLLCRAIQKQGLPASQPCPQALGVLIQCLDIVLQSAGEIALAEEDIAQAQQCSRVPGILGERQAVVFAGTVHIPFHEKGFCHSCQGRVILRLQCQGPGKALHGL